MFKEFIAHDLVHIALIEKYTSITHQYTLSDKYMHKLQKVAVKTTQIGQNKWETSTEYT